MSVLEDVQQMQAEGMEESVIIARLQEQGVPYRDISDAIAQSKIKAAVEGTGGGTDQNTSFMDSGTAPQAPLGMQPSIMQNPDGQDKEEYFPAYAQNAPTANQTYEYGQGGYEYNSAALSSDTIAEISEQIVSERLSDMRKKMEKIISSKTELDAKTESIEERLKRVEKIIDTLQVSILRKVGDYVTNVEDIKKELVETQKTIGRALGSRHEHKK